jgi:hypothetical protein
MHPGKMSPKQCRSYGDSNWVPFVLNRLRNLKDKSILLFRESTDDVYFRPIKETMCKRLQCEAYDEGMSFTEAIQLELQNTSLPIAKEMNYFGWKLIYYPISTQKAYPHLTQVTVLDAHDGNDAVDDMIRFDYVKRYVAGSCEDINSIFAQFRKHSWKMLKAEVPLVGMHRSVKTMVGCVMQTINDQTCIVIRSFRNKKSQLIQRFACMMHQYEHAVLISMLNPIHCIYRMEGQGEMESEICSSSNDGNDGNEEVYWHTHGHVRFSWHIVGDREFEVRFGGTILLGDHSLDSKIVELGEVLINWEQYVILKFTTVVPVG